MSDHLEPDAVLSSAEMRVATGLADLEMLAPGAVRVPDGYALAEPTDAEAILFQTSGQDFLVWCRPFLHALAKYGTVSRACREAGITRRDYRLAMQLQHGFPEAVADAEDEFNDSLEERLLMVVAPFEKDKETGEEVAIQPWEKAYNLLWRTMQGRRPERYASRVAKSTRPLSGDQKKFLVEAIIRQGFTRSEAESMVDLGAAAIALAERSE